MTRTAQERNNTQISRDWWTMLAGPMIYFVYFMIVYSLAEFGCRGGWIRFQIAGLHAASVITVGLTLVALALSAFYLFRALQAWRRMRSSHDANLNRANERGHFMTLTGVLLGSLFTYLTLLTGLPALVLQPCL